MTFDVIGQEERMGVICRVIYMCVCVCVIFVLGAGLGGKIAYLNCSTT